MSTHAVVLVAVTELVSVDDASRSVRSTAVKGTAPRRALLVGLVAVATACRGSTSHTTATAKHTQDSAGPGVTVVAGAVPVPTSSAQIPPTTQIPLITTSMPPPTTRAQAPTTGPRTAATTAAPGSIVATIATVTAADLGGSWRAGCPVGPDQLRLLHLSYWGFDNQAHLGSLVVNTAVTADVQKIFARLFSEHFPIHQMQPIAAYGGSDPASMSADNTSGFNCRYAVTIPPTNQWSVHAFGEAIDVNTVENPYLEGGAVLPAEGAAFVDRSSYRPGMAVAGGQLVQAFASTGWQWGGRWSSPDYQHFSKTGG
jgi:hypothetical protein